MRRAHQAFVRGSAACVWLEISMHQHMDYASCTLIAVGNCHYVHLIILQHILFLHARASPRFTSVQCKCTRLRAGIMRARARRAHSTISQTGAHNVVFTCGRAGMLTSIQLKWQSARPVCRAPRAITFLRRVVSVCWLSDCSGRPGRAGPACVRHRWFNVHVEHAYAAPNNGAAPLAAHRPPCIHEI